MDESRRCTARSTRSKERCKKAAVKGATVCQTHGGGASQVKAAAKRRQEQAAAAKAVESLSVPVDTTPEDALLGEVRHIAGDVKFLRDQVKQLGGSLTQTNYGPGGASSEVPDVWLEMYWQAHDRLVKVCAATIKAGIEERRVRLAEEQGQVLADAIRGMLADLGVEITPEVSGVVRRHLELVA